MPKMQAVNEVWMATGRVTKILDHHRMMSVYDIAHSIGLIACEMLPAAHCLTGCATISSFFGIGKNMVFQVLKKLSIEVVNSLKALGKRETSASTDAQRPFVAILYDRKSNFKHTHNSLIM